MDQKEIDAIEQLTRDLNTELNERQRYVPLSDVTEYSFQIDPHIKVSFIERRAHEASSYRHRRTILKTKIPKTDLQIQKASVLNKLWNGNSQGKYKVESSNDRLREKLSVNKDLNTFLDGSERKLTVRTKEKESHCVLELRYEDFILNTEVIRLSARFMEKLKEIVLSEIE